jgi:hypothetical protein
LFSSLLQPDYVPAGILRLQCRLCLVFIIIVVVLIVLIIIIVFVIIVFVIVLIILAVLVIIIGVILTGVVVVIGGLIIGTGVFAPRGDMLSGTPRREGDTNLNVLNHLQDGALRPDVAVGRTLELAAQDRLDGRHWPHVAILLQDDWAVCLRQGQFIDTQGPPCSPPSMKIAGRAHLELRVPRRLAVADLKKGGVRLWISHAGGLAQGRGADLKCDRKQQENRRKDDE